MAARNNQNKNNNGVQRQQVTVSGIPPKVADMFQQTHPGFNMPQQQQPMSGAPAGDAPAVASTAPAMNFFQQGGGVKGAYDLAPESPAPAQPLQPVQTGAAPTTSFEGFQPPQFKPEVQPQHQGDLASLSQALSMAGAQPQQPQFHADPSQRDGGFFGWLSGILPRNRKGMRAGETPDEYDARMTQNSQRYFALADAIRHFGNIINTSKGAPLQQFNDPVGMLEQGYQQRKAARQKQAALDADAAYKQANMDLKDQQAQSDAAYKALLLNLNRERQQWREGRDERNYNHKVEREGVSDQFKVNKFKADQEQREISNNLRAQSIAKRGGGRSGKSGSGSSAKYWFEGKDGKMHYQPNKTMWEQEYYREYGVLPQGETSTSTSTKITDLRTGQETTTTTRRKGASMTSQAAKQQNAARDARKNQGARRNSKLKNTSALGL